ncbi:queuosine precursor transporter, partial [Xanthovirga aplysinae]|uniref:queuosine precursor transporter n=1 Tax=Xanthovirga aplysinae TaxID=2529853 RepID=UPI0012BB8AFC
LFLVLGGIFITNAVLAEMIGVKIFSLENTLGFEPVKIFGKYSFNLTAGVMIWPVVFITTDIINEYFGKAGVKKISYLATSLIAYMFVVIALVTRLSPADFWMQINNQDPEGNPFNMNFAFNKIFMQGLGIIIGSLVAFLVGQLLDVYVFVKIKNLTGTKMIWLRATGSTLVSQLVDSFVVLFIAFYIFGNFTLQEITNIAIVNYIYKFCIAVVLTPLLYVAHGIIDAYLGKEKAKEMVQLVKEEKVSV